MDEFSNGHDIHKYDAKGHIKHQLSKPEPTRNDVLEEVAKEFDKMKVFGDTAQSFAIFVRGMKT